MFHDKNGNIICIGDTVVCDEHLGPFPAGSELKVVAGPRRVLLVAAIRLDAEFATSLEILRRGDGSVV